MLEFLHGNAGESQTACTMVGTLIVPSQQICLAISRAYIRGSSHRRAVASFPAQTCCCVFSPSLLGELTQWLLLEHYCGRPFSVLKRHTQLPVQYNVMC